MEDFEKMNDSAELLLIDNNEIKNNIDKLYEVSNDNVNLFIDTIIDLKESQDFYEQIHERILSLDEDELYGLAQLLTEQTFNNKDDVVSWLERLSSLGLLWYIGE